MTEEELRQIEERCNASTEGPWVYPNGGCVSSFAADRHIVDHGGRLSPEDGDFIAHARVDVPALIAEVRRQREMLSAARIVSVPLSFINAGPAGIPSKPEGWCDRWRKYIPTETASCADDDEEED